MLKREISKSHLLFISFAAIFGSGWLFAPLYAAQIAGPASLIAWALGALISAVIGITMAEVVVLYPRSGGLSQISGMTHGEFLSLLITLLNLVVFTILPAIEVRAVLQYGASHFPELVNPDRSFSMMGYGVALALLALITLVNLYGARITAALTQVIVLFKIVTPALICFSFLYAIGGSRAFDLARLLPQEAGRGIPWTQVFQAIATSGIIFSFNGFNQATMFAGEAKNPQRAIPFAILGSLLASGLLYLAIQYAFLMAVPAESFAHGWNSLTFPHDEGPFAGLAILLGLGSLLAVIYADAVISPLGTAFSYASAAPRILYGLTEGSKLSFSRNLLKLNSYGISPVLVGLILIVECLAFIFLPSLKAMISLLVAAFVLSYTVAPASLLALRKTHPQLHRPFRVFWAPLTSFLSVFFSNLMVFSCGWGAVRNLIAVVLVLVAIFGVQVTLRDRSVLFVKMRGSIWFFFQLFALGGLAYSDHQSQLPFWVSASCVGALSAVALVLSRKFSNEGIESHRVS